MDPAISNINAKLANPLSRNLLPHDIVSRRERPNTGRRQEESRGCVNDEDQAPVAGDSETDGAENHIGDTAEVSSSDTASSRSEGDWTAGHVENLFVLSL